MNELGIIVGIAYATVVAFSYRRTGFLPALLWPLTIIVAGTAVYLRVVMLEERPPEE